MPLPSFSSASAGVVHSWSEPIPAAIYADRSPPVSPGAWPSTLFPASRKKSYFVEKMLVLVEHAGIVHHLSEAEHPRLAQEWVHVRRVERGSRRIEARCGNTRRDHEVHIDGQGFARGEHVPHAVVTEDVGDLVGIGHDGRGPPRRDDAGVFGEKSIEDSMCTCESTSPGARNMPLRSSVRSACRPSSTPATRPRRIEMVIFLRISPRSRSSRVQLAKLRSQVTAPRAASISSDPVMPPPDGPIVKRGNPEMSNRFMAAVDGPICFKRQASVHRLAEAQSWMDCTFESQSRPRP